MNSSEERIVQEKDGEGNGRGKTGKDQGGAKRDTDTSALSVRVEVTG